jgi:hypothetical protein
MTRTVDYCGRREGDPGAPGLLSRAARTVVQDDETSRGGAEVAEKIACFEFLRVLRASA